MWGVYRLRGLIYHATLPAVDGVGYVKVSLVENWLVYHYYDGKLGRFREGVGRRRVGGLLRWRRMGLIRRREVNGSFRSYRRKVFIDDLDSSDMSAYSSKNNDVLILEQSYVYPHAVMDLAPTTTKFGIAVRTSSVCGFFVVWSIGCHAQCTTVASRMQYIQRLLLNPRRLNRKTTAEEQDFLVPHEPLIAYDLRVYCRITTRYDPILYLQTHSQHLFSRWLMSRRLSPPPLS